MKSARRRVDVNLDELDQVLDGARQAPLSQADYDKLKGALHALAAMLVRPRHTEKTSAVLEKPEGSEVGAGAQPDTNPPPSPGHGRHGAEAFGGAQKVDIAHQNLKHGDRCPECGKGNVYGQKEPRVLVRIVGQAPLAATVYSLERLRCGACGQVFTAPEPEGVGPEKYDETAAAMIAQLKYGSGTPFHRLEKLEALLGIPLPAATQWEIVEEAAELIQPVRDELIRQAAQGEVVHNDDTSMKVLKLEREPGDERTGVFTSGIVSTGQGQKIALYFTGRQHAGENIGDVLKQRAKDLSPVIQMCDALSRNVPKLASGVEILVANCLAHYLDSGIIRSECEIDAPVQGGSGVSGMFTPDKASQAFEEREQFRRWPPFSRCRRVKPGSLPKGLEHIALHLKIGRNVSARGGHRCMTEVISNH